MNPTNHYQIIRSLLDKPKSPLINKEINVLIRAPRVSLEKCAYLFAQKSRLDLLLGLLEIDPSHVRYAMQLLSSHITDFPLHQLSIVWKSFLQGSYPLPTKFVQGFQTLFEEAVRTTNKQKQHTIFRLLAHNSSYLEEQHQHDILALIITCFIAHLPIAPLQTPSFLFLLHTLLKIDQNASEKGLLSQFSSGHCSLILKRLQNALLLTSKKEVSQLQQQALSCILLLSKYRCYTVPEMEAVLTLNQPFMFRAATRSYARQVKTTYKRLLEGHMEKHKQKGKLRQVEIAPELPKASIEKTLQKVNDYRLAQWMHRAGESQVRPLETAPPSPLKKESKQDRLEALVQSCFSNFPNFPEYQKIKPVDVQPEIELIGTPSGSAVGGQEGTESREEWEINALIDLVYDYKFPAQ